MHLLSILFGKYKPNIDERKEPEEEDQSLSVSVPYVQGVSEIFKLS